MGSIDAERHAGSNEAAKASMSTKNVAWVKQEQLQQARGRGGAQQSDGAAYQGKLGGGGKNQARIPDRCEPNAMRIAISCSRRAAEKAIML